MSTKQKTPASGNDVRGWGIANRPDLVAEPREGETFARGRVGKALVEAYHEANPDRVYTPRHKNERTFELTESTRDSKGRKRSRKVSVTLSQVRELAGELAKAKGVPSNAALEAAAEELSNRAQARKDEARANA